MDADWLRQMSIMSIDNANIAIQQAKMNFDKALEDYQMDLLTRRINGGGNNLLDRLKNEFEKKGVMTIKNYEKIINTLVEYRGEQWKVVGVSQTNTAYYFELESRNNFFLKEITIGLNRVPIAGKAIGIYTLRNDKTGSWVGIGKEVIKNVNSLMVKMVELTDETF